MSLCATKHHAMKTYRGRKVRCHRFLTSALGRVSGQLHALAGLSTMKELPVPIRWAPDQLGILSRGKSRSTGEERTCVQWFCNK